MNGKILVLALAMCMAAVIVQADQAQRSKPQPISAELRERCLKILEKGLQSDEFWPSMHAAEALTLAGHGKDVIVQLKDRLPKETDDQKRCGLARELSRAGDRQYVRVLLQILEDEKSMGRVHAAESLYKIAEKGDGKSLAAAVRQSESIRLKIMAAGALAKAGDTAALAVLRKTLLSEDVEARNLAAWILSRLGDSSDVQPLLTTLSKETNGMARAFCAVALACLGNEDGRAELGVQLSSDDPVARAMAAEFVAHSRSVEFRDKLISMLDDPALDVRIRSAQSLIALSMP